MRYFQWEKWLFGFEMPYFQVEKWLFDFEIPYFLVEVRHFEFLGSLPTGIMAFWIFRVTSNGK
jgi:hypothetical protein